MQTLTVFSDYICPFCFIGKRKAERLAEEFPIQLLWKAYEIHPEVPPEGIPLSRLMPEMISGIETRVRQLAEEAGVEMRLPAVLANSRLALLGGEFARETAKSHEYHEAVFSAYFQQGKNIGDIDVLAELSIDIGLNGDSFREALSNERYMQALKESRHEAHSLGLTAVPSFVFADGNIVVGAQPNAVLTAAAERSFQKDGGDKNGQSIS